MAQAFTVEATIDRSADEVWRTLTDWSAAPRWMAGVESLAIDGELRPGASLRFRSRGKERLAEVVEVEPAHALVTRSRQGGVTADYHYRLRPTTDGGTVVSLTADVRTRGVMSLLGPVLRWAIRRSDANQVEALRQLIEAS